MSKILYPLGKTIYHKKNGSNLDIRKVLENPQIMANAIHQTKAIAQKFKGASTRDTCYNIWKYLKNNIRYKEDGLENQNIKLPSRFLKDKSGDCKSYSLFTAAVLANLGINSSWTYASYNSDPTPQHVYITTANGTIVDGVWTGFDKEKRPTYKTKKTVRNGS
jgi:hypothetical protein